MRKTILAVGAIGLIGASWLIGPGLASNLSETSTTLSADDVAITRCDPDGVTPIYNHEAVSPFRILSVTVSGISSGCGSLTIRVTVNNGLTNTSGSATVPGAGGSVTVTLSTPTALRDTTQTEISLS